MYPLLWVSQALEREPGLAREVWQALKRISEEDMIQEGRVYGGGLHKLEPRELSKVPADEIATLLR